jgi:hypothetical protein
MHVKFLTDSSARASGAMFSKPLLEDIMVFVYPISAPRLFHTFFCPPLRIVALDKTGEPLFDEVVQPNRFVRLPACTYVLETDPQVQYQPYLEDILKDAKGFQLPQAGTWQAEVPVDALIFALLAEAVADLRRVRDARQRGIELEALPEHFQVWERGQIVSSAGFILDFSRGYDIPAGALRLSRSVLQAEQPHLDELFAASVAGVPWQREVGRECLRCGRGGQWRPILDIPAHTPVEVAWRALRPENFVPLCHRCVETIEFHHKPELRLALAAGLWGQRFEAFQRWHRALENQNLPEWDKLAYPLWPPEYGGETWETGSGALQDAEPRGAEGVCRNPEQIEALKRALFSKRIQKRHLEKTPLRNLLELGDYKLVGGNQ